MTPGGQERTRLPSMRRRAAVIAGLGVLAFVWSVTLGRPDLFPAREFSDAFDLQARALLAGDLHVPDGSLGFEGFIIDGRTYAYFGVFPALLRIPILLVTGTLDGRLTTVSMIVAYALALWAAVRVVLGGHHLLTGDRPLTRTGRQVATALLAVLAVGSNLYFLSSAAWMYHEASLWGAAGVLGAFAAMIGYLRDGRPRRLLVAGLWTFVAWNARGSVGVAPSAVLGLIGIAHLTGWRWLDALVPAPTHAVDAEAGADADVPGWPRSPRLAALCLAAALGGALVFGAVNTAKFGSPTALPMDKQVSSLAGAAHRTPVLEEYGGSMFSPRLAPSVVAQSLRPDLLELTSTWPFLRFSHAQPPTWFGVVWDTVEPSAGLTLTSPLLLALGLPGAAAALWWSRRARGRRTATGARGELAVLRPFLIGGALAFYGPATIAFIAQRYLTDLLPLLVVASTAGLVLVDDLVARSAVDRAARADGSSPERHRWIGALAAVLAIGGIAVTLTTTWVFQRHVVPPDAPARTAALRAQLAVSDLVGDPPPVTRYAVLPAKAETDVLAVRGDCAGLYVGLSNGDWRPVEVGAAGGHHRVTVRPDRLDGVARAVLWVGDETDHLVVTIQAAPAGDDAVLGLMRDGRVVATSEPVELDEGAVELLLEADPTLAWVNLAARGEHVAFAHGRPPDVVEAGTGARPPGAVAPLAGVVEILPTPTPTCDALVAAAGGR